jgi:hypothetical protein
MTSDAERFRRRTLITDLRSRGCRCCAETEPAIMDLHHVDPELKRFALGSTRSFAMSREEFDAEILKVITICPTCHRLHHVGLLEIPEDESEPCERRSS